MDRAILLGDPHIGRSISLGKTGIGSNLNSRIADQVRLLDHVLERSLEKEINHIIITGDVFEDPRPHPSLIALLISWLKKCQAHCIQVHIIMGNHDLLRSGDAFTSSLDIIAEMDLDGISVHKHTNTIIIGTSAFTLMPYRDRKCFSVASNATALGLIRDSLIYELASIPTTYHKVVVGHLAIEGSIPVGDEIDDMANEIYCPLDMFRGYDNVWMGHVHKPQVLQDSHPYIAHIGSMDISNFGETNHQKHIVIFDCLTGEWETETLPTRPLKKLSMHVPKDTPDPTAYVIQEISKSEANLSQAIIRVEIFLSTPELKSVDKGQVEQFLMQQGAFNITGISESKKTSTIKKDANTLIDTKMDVPSAIKTYADRYIDAPARPGYIELSMEIYNAYKAEVKE